MLASTPASILNQNYRDLGIPNRFSPKQSGSSHNLERNAELHSGEAPFEGVIAASWEGRYRSPPRPKSLREIMKEKESNERD